MDVRAKFGEGKMELQRLPEPLERFLLGLRAHQQVQRVAVSGQQTRNEIAAQVAGGAGYEDRHSESGGDTELGAADTHAACADQSSLRGARASSGRPSISG